MTLPSPLAADGAVSNDPGRRTLVVRPAESGGYAALLWRHGHRALVQAEESGHYGALVWAHGLGRREIARRQPEPDGSLRFTMVVVDRETSHIMGVRFHHRKRG